MEVELNDTYCKVIREPGDPKIYSESTLLYKVKRELIKQGYDVIKKRMWKDGHLFGSDTTQYIRSRRTTNKPFLMIYDESYQLRLSYEDYNKGELILTVDRS